MLRPREKFNARSRAQSGESCNGVSVRRLLTIVRQPKGETRSPGENSLLPHESHGDSLYGLWSWFPSESLQGLGILAARWMTIPIDPKWRHQSFDNIAHMGD